MNSHELPAAIGRLFEDARLYTTEQRCAITGETPAAVRMRRSRGHDAPFVRYGARVRYPGAALNKFFAERLVDPAEQAAERRAADAEREAQRSTAQAQHRAAVDNRRTRMAQKRAK